MGVEISYICDACGRDCTENHYVVDIVHRINGHQPLRFTVNENAPILCPDCFVRHLHIFTRDLVGEWMRDEEDDLP